MLRCQRVARGDLVQVQHEAEDVVLGVSEDSALGHGRERGHLIHKMLQDFDGIRYVQRIARARSHLHLHSAKQPPDAALALAAQSVPANLRGAAVGSAVKLAHKLSEASVAYAGS